MILIKMKKAKTIRITKAHSIFEKLWISITEIIKP